MRIVFIGHSVAVKKCIQKLESTSHEVVALFTHPREDHQRDLEIYDQRRDLFGDYGYDVFQLHQDFQIPVHEYDNLSDEKWISEIKKYTPDLICTIGCRDILTSEFIRSFNKVINLHPYHLPFFRGAGIDTWMILQGQSGKEQRATCHFITPRIDAGQIIATAPYLIPEEARPIDIFKVRMDTLGGLLISALDALDNGSNDFKDQQESDSVYYPRLRTMRDGRILFNQWGGKEIALFIRAFSYPYEGAWCEVDKEMYHFHSCDFIPHDDVHPFALGIISRKSEKEI
ncbi:MAG: methionyl-tRNA formyltransferase, partial [Flavobacteriales bacterium]